MPWDSSAADGGFGSVTPWLPVGEENLARAVDIQEDDEHSLVCATRFAIALRNAHAALHHGRVVDCRADGDLLEIRREAAGQTIACRFNLGASPIDMEPATGTILHAENGASAEMLPPFGALIWEI